MEEEKDICQDTNQTLFKPCQGSEEVPCNKPVPVSLSEEPCCPLHLRLPPPDVRPRAGPGCASGAGGCSHGS
ncbi:hypothetical protein DV515_00017957, partial [Chloebia gouldiae]